MGTHPVNLIFRFLLELIFLAIYSLWGYKQLEGWPAVLLAVFMPAGAMLIWGIFNVPEDPSRSGKAPVAVPGPIRLLIELSLFGLAVWFLFDMDFPRFCFIFGALVIIHYFISYDRILWLLSR